MKALDKLHEALHKLGTPTVILWTIVQIDEQCLDVRKTLMSGLPPINETIHQAITGHFGGHCIEEQLIGGWEENSHRCDRCRRVKVVIGGPGDYATFPSTSKGADLHRRFGIHRDP